MAMTCLCNRPRTSPRIVLQPGSGRNLSSRNFRPLVLALQPHHNDVRCREDQKSITQSKSSADTPQWQRTLAGATAGFCTWFVALPALANINGPDTSIVGPTADDLLGAGPDFSFTSLLMFTLLGYWLIKAALYISQNTPDGPDNTKQQQQSGNKELTDIGHAHIRSYVDSSQPGAGGDTDAKDLRNASLARSAAFRVKSALKESEPRIHAMVEEMAAPQSPWPLRPPRNADVDFVAAMVYNRMMQERSAKGPDYVLGSRERAVLETRLLEEVAERVAAEQVAEFIKMAAKGTLHPPGPGGKGADQHPHSHAH